MYQFTLLDPSYSAIFKKPLLTNDSMDVSGNIYIHGNIEVYNNSTLNFTNDLNYQHLRIVRKVFNPYSSSYKGGIVVNGLQIWDNNINLIEQQRNALSDLSMVFYDSGGTQVDEVSITSTGGQFNLLDVLATTYEVPTIDASYETETYVLDGEQYV